MRIIGLIITVFSILMLLGTCVGWGFYEQILQSGFNPSPILFACIFLSIAGIITGFAMCCGLFEDL